VDRTSAPAPAAGRAGQIREDRRRQRLGRTRSE